MDGPGGGEAPLEAEELSSPEAPGVAALLCSALLRHHVLVPEGHHWSLTAELLVAVGDGGLVAAGVQQQLRQPVHWRDRRLSVRRSVDTNGRMDGRMGRRRDRTQEEEEKKSPSAMQVVRSGAPWRA